MKGETLGIFILFSCVFWIQNLQVCKSHHATCDRTYSKVDCVYTYQNRKRIYNELIITDRDHGSPKYSGIPTDWVHWEEYLLGLVCRCAEKLKRISDGNVTIYNQFTIENYGECWSTKYSYDSLHTLARSNNCIGAGYLNCPTESMSECTGIELSSFLYQINNRSKPLDEHCHIERKIVCPYSVLIYNSSSPSQVVKSSKFVIHSFTISPHTSSLMESIPLVMNSMSFQLSRAMTRKFSSIGTTLYESMINKLSNQTYSMFSKIQSLNTRQLYTSGSKHSNINLAPTQFLIASSRNITETPKLSIIECIKTYHSSSINLTRSSETKGSLDVRKSQQQSIPTKTSTQQQVANESYYLLKESSSIRPCVPEPSSIQPSTNETSFTQPSIKEISFIQPSTKKTSYIESSSKRTSSIGPATNSEAILETSRLNFGLSSIKTNPIDVISVQASQSNLSTENNNKTLSCIPHTLLSLLSSWQLNITSSLVTTSQASDTTPSLSMSYKSQPGESNVGYISTTQILHASLPAVPLKSPDVHFSPSTTVSIRFSETSESSLSRDIPTLSKVLLNMTQNIIIESLFKSSPLLGNTSTIIPESSWSNGDSIQTKIQGNHASTKQETREKSMTPLLNSASTHAAIEIAKSSTSRQPTKSLNMMSTNQMNEASVPRATLVEIIPTSVSAQQSSSSLVKQTSSAMQKVMSNHINVSYETKVTPASDFKTILDSLILQTVKSKQTETSQPSIITTLTSSFMSKYSENFDYNMTTGETDFSKSQLKSLSSPNYHVTKSINNITTGNSSSESATLLEPKQSSVGKSSSVAPSTQPNSSCKNTGDACKRNSGTNTQLPTTLLAVIAIQLMLIRLVSLSD